MKDRKPKGKRIDVWINPAAHQDASSVAQTLRTEFHLIVVPKTGSRQADVAVLCDPQPQEISRIRHILRGVPLLATTTKEPSAALRSELRRSGGRVLTQPSSAELIEAVAHLCHQGPSPC